MRIVQAVAFVVLLPMLLVGCVLRPSLSSDEIVGTWQVDTRWTAQTFLDEYGGQDGTIEFLADGTFIMRDVPLRAFGSTSEPGNDLGERGGRWSIARTGLNMSVTSGSAGVGTGTSLQIEHGLSGITRITFWIDIDALDRYSMVRRASDRAE